MFRSERVLLFRLPRIRLDVSKCEKRFVRALAQNAPSGSGRAAKGLGLACDARTLLSAGAIWWLVSPPMKRRTSLRYPAESIRAFRSDGHRAATLALSWRTLRGGR